MDILSNKHRKTWTCKVDKENHNWKEDCMTISLNQDWKKKGKVEPKGLEY